MVNIAGVPSRKFVEEIFHAACVEETFYAVVPDGGVGARRSSRQTTRYQDAVRLIRGESLMHVEISRQPFHPSASQRLGHEHAVGIINVFGERRAKLETITRVEIARRRERIH